MSNRFALILGGLALLFIVITHVRSCHSAQPDLSISEDSVAVEITVDGQELAKSKQNLNSYLQLHGTDLCTLHKEVRESQKRVFDQADSLYGGRFAIRKSNYCISWIGYVDSAYSAELKKITLKYGLVDSVFSQVRGMDRDCNQ